MCYRKNMRNVIVIHGCPSNAEKTMDPATRTYDKHWMPWLKEQLVKLGVPVEMPLMPNPWEPSYDAFKTEFDKCTLDEDSILVGHSCGTAFLTRWLGDTKQRVAKLILVAPWYFNDKKDDLSREAFYEHPIDASIRDRVGEIVVFTADDEEESGKRSAVTFHERLGARVIELKGRGHYTMGDMGTTEFPELLEEILR